MAKIRPQPDTADAWREVLVRSKAQAEAGQTVPLLPVLERLRATAERLEAELGVSADEVDLPPEA